MEKSSGKRSISGLAALILLGVFAAGILTVLLSGAASYKGLTERDAISYDRRTCVQYLANKVRQAPAPGSVVLSDFGDSDSLLIREEINGHEYWTQVYCHDGWIMELFTAADAGLLPQDGERILPAHSLSFELNGNLLQLSITDENGVESSVLLALRGREEGNP